MGDADGPLEPRFSEGVTRRLTEIILRYNFMRYFRMRKNATTGTRAPHNLPNLHDFMKVKLYIAPFRSNLTVAAEELRPPSRDCSAISETLASTSASWTRT
jgi:hypothetical protein